MTMVLTKISLRERIAYCAHFETQAFTQMKPCINMMRGYKNNVRKISLSVHGEGLRWLSKFSLFVWRCFIPGLVLLLLNSIIEFSDCPSDLRLPLRTCCVRTFVSWKDGNQSHLALVQLH
jgi:hypothetical protein